MALLKRLSNFSGKKPVVICVIDGVGIAPPSSSNAFTTAKTPWLDWLKQNALYGEIKAHGTAVGLPSDEDMGNSEVGHNTLGSGRILPQGSSLVNLFFQEDDFKTSRTWKQLIENTLNNQSTLHLLGLLSDGGVHSHMDHLKRLIAQALKEGIKTIRIHALLDGRDVEPVSAEKYIRDIEFFIKEASDKHSSDIAIASCGGRENITMDRYEANWGKVEKGWKTHVEGDAPLFASALEGLKHMQKDGTIDQFLEPFVIGTKKPIGTIEDGDSVLTFNFRGDRVLEISQAFMEEKLPHIRKTRHPKIYYAGMLLYDADRGIPKNYLVSFKKVDDPMGYYQTQMGQKLFAISETQKYGHVTYFWNGNRSGKMNEELETYVEIPSDAGDFDKNPAMKAYEITAKTIEMIESANYDSGRINFPNGDMVGHTGNLNAVIRSLEVVDECIKQLMDSIKKVGGVLIILGDHGNSEEMLDKKGGVKTSHTTNPVPFYLYDPTHNGQYKLQMDEKSGLANVASTVFELMGYEPPKSYAPSLIRFLS